LPLLPEATRGQFHNNHHTLISAVLLKALSSGPLLREHHRVSNGEHCYNGEII